jgi:hypothetical protein
VPEWHENGKSVGQSKRYPASHLVYSPGLSPCDFWLFGMLEHRITDRQLKSSEENLDAVSELRDEITVEELQNVFLAWMEQL